MVFRTLAFAALAFLSQTLFAVVDVGLKVGDMAPAIEVLDIHGANYSLKKQLEKAPAVVVFYRGGWCPYCNIQLQKIEQALIPELNQMGVSLVAISSDKVDGVTKNAFSKKLSFSIISDTSFEIVEKFKLKVKLDDKTLESYRKKLKINLKKQSSGFISNAAVYVVSKTGKIIYAFASSDPKKRSPHSEIIAALRPEITSHSK